MYGLPLLLAALLAGATGEVPADKTPGGDMFHSRTPVVPVEDGINYTMVEIEGADVDVAMALGYSTEDDAPAEPVF